MSDEQNTSQKSILDVTIADVLRENTRAEAADSVAGVPQDMINLRSLQSEADVLQAQADEHMAKNGYVPPSLQNQLTAKLNTLDYQRGLYKRNQSPDGLERRDAINKETTETQRDTEYLQRARDNDLRLAVNKLMRQERDLTKFEALQLVQQRIATEGEQAILPIYSRVKARLANRHSAPAPSAPAARQRTPASNVVDGHDLDKMRATIQRAQAAGEDVSDSVALLKYLESKRAAA